MNLLSALGDKGLPVRFSWLSSQYGFGGNEIVDQLANETSHYDIYPLSCVHYADLKPRVNSCVPQVAQVVESAQGMELYLLKVILSRTKYYKKLVINTTSLPNRVESQGLHGTF